MAINTAPNRYDWYSRICLAATMLAITGLYCNSYTLIIIAALLTSACIIDSRGYGLSDEDLNNNTPR